MIKKLIYLFMILCVTFSMTSCQNKVNISYETALRTTKDIQQGIIEIEYNHKIVFDETELSFEEKKMLSAFENISGIMTSKYDYIRNQIESSIYYIQGGVGIDSSVFIKNNEIIIRVPLLNLYMVFNEEELMNQFSSIKKDKAMNDQISNKMNNEEHNRDQMKKEVGVQILFNNILEKWLSIIKEETFSVEKKADVLTDEGQIKTTKYTFDLDQEQLALFQEHLLKDIDFNELNKAIMNQISNISDNDDLSIDSYDLLQKIQLNHLDVEAFVDDENRLLKQKITIYGNGTHISPGEIESFEVTLVMTYSRLGEEQKFEFPILTKDNVIKLEDLNEIFNKFGN